MTTTFVPFTQSTSTIPLPTIFTPPPSCSSHWTYEASIYNGINSGILMQNAFQTGLDTGCFPSGFKGNGRGYETQVFSPGACPHGYGTQSPYLVDGVVTTATCC